MRTILPTPRPRTMTGAVPAASGIISTAASKRCAGSYSPLVALVVDNL